MSIGDEVKIDTSRGKPVEPLRTSTEVVQRIQKLFAAERANPQKATRRDEIPETYELITTEWLTANLGHEVEGAEVVDMSLGPRDDGTANRRHIFMTWNDEGKRANLPESVFCKKLKANEALANRINMSFSLGASEPSWFNIFRPKVGIVTPKAFFAKADPVSLNSIVVLEDLAEKVKFLNIKTYYTKEMVKQQLATLAKLHGQFWGSTDQDVLDVVSFRGGFVGLDVSTDTKQACINGFHAAREVIPERLYKRHAEVWPATVISYERNWQYTQTLTHNDCHPGNWFQYPDGTLGLQDFQCFARGHFARDIAYCLGSSATIKDRREWQDELLRFYLDELHKNGGPLLSINHAWDEIRLQSFAALAYWTLTLRPTPEFMPDMQSADTCMRTIERQAVFMDDIDAFSAVSLGIYVDSQTS